MLENNFFRDNNQEDELIKKFNLRTSPMEYSDIDSINYSYRISENNDLSKNPDNLIKQMFEMLPSNLSEKHVIDIGCGEGRWSRLMAEKGAIVTGIDSSQKMIEIAKQRSQEFNKKIELLNLNINDLINVDKQFDFALSCYTFNNISKLSDIFQILNKVINNGGELLIATKLLDFKNSQNKLLKNYFLPINIKNKYKIYTYGNELSNYEESAKNSNFELIGSYLSETDNNFANEELNKQNIKIFDAILKYKKISY
ncbi:MAG: class I SAM-dependent methyltransferase [Candidatus Absconditabacterales bacterium]|jgi:ubiquinone/menaquinone biosynthesis C-methylase UbiE